MLEFAFEDEEQDFGKMTGFNEGERNYLNLSNEYKLILMYEPKAIEVPYDFEPPQHDIDDSKSLLIFLFDNCRLI